MIEAAAYAESLTITGVSPVAVEFRLYVSALALYRGEGAFLQVYGRMIDSPVRLSGVISMRPFFLRPRVPALSTATQPSLLFCRYISNRAGRTINSILSVRAHGSRKGRRIVMRFKCKTGRGLRRQIKFHRASDLRARENSASTRSRL